MSVLNNNTTDNQFELLHTTAASGDWSAILSTENKFVDKNIAIKISTPAAGALTFTATDNNTTDVTVDSLDGNKYPLIASISGKLKAATAGWITANEYSISDNSVVVGTINKAVPTTSFSNTGMLTYFDEVTSPASASDYNVSITPKYTNTAGYLEAHGTATNAGGEKYWNIKTVTPTFKASPTGSSDAQFSNITYNTTNNGIKVQTRYAINAVKIQYNAAATGWIDKAASADTGSSTTKKDATNGGVYYITGITVPTGTAFTLTTATNTNTDTSKITITNNNNRNIEITNSGNVYARQTTSGKGNVYVRPYGASSDIQIVSNGSMLMSTHTPSTWTKNSTSKVATMQGFIYTDGYTTADSLDAATFNNAATSGVTYVDLSDALVSANGAYVVPEIGTDGNLYINRGYIDNVKISLAHLMPGTESTTKPITSDHILSGYEAYDKDGRLIVGSINEKTSSNLSFNTSTGVFTAPAGYYATDATKTIGIGTITPNYNFPGSNDNDLDNYITTSGASSSSYDVSINKTYTNTVGYIAAHSTSQNAGTVYYKLKAPAFESAGGSSSLVADTTNTTTARSIYTASTNTFISIGSSAPAFDTTGKVYIKVSSSDQIKTTSTGRGALKSNTTIATKGTHTSYIGLILYDGSYTTS